MTVVDKFGYSFQVGCKVLRPVMWGKSPMIDLCEVTRIDSSGKIYLDNSKQAMRFPERLVIWDQDPLYRMLKHHEQQTNR